MKPSTFSKIILAIIGLSLLSLCVSGQSTDAAMTTQANVIRNETAQGGNTRARIADMYQALIDSKVNVNQNAFVTASGTNTYTATITPAINTYAGLRVYVLFTNANTGSSTINFNGLGAITIKKNSTQNLESGDIKNGQIKLIAYDGTSFQLVGIGASGIIGPVSSTDNAIVRFDGTNGKTIQNSTVTIDDTGNVITPDGVYLGLSATQGLSLSSGAIEAFAGSNNNAFQLSNVGEIFFRSTNVQQHELVTANTNTVNSNFLFTSTSTGTPAVGIGSGITFSAETSASNYEEGAKIEAVTTDVTPTSEDFALSFKTMDAGSTATEKFRIQGTDYFLGGSTTPGTVRSFEAVGSQTNISIVYETKGTGTHQFTGNGIVANVNSLQISSSDGSIQVAPTTGVILQSKTGSTANSVPLNIQSAGGFSGSGADLNAEDLKIVGGNGDTNGNGGDLYFNPGDGNGTGINGTIYVRDGSNRTMGIATLVGGTVTINNNLITANTRIFYSVQTAGGTQGFLRTTRSAGTSFTITSTSATETSTVAWFLVEPN